MREKKIKRKIMSQEYLFKALLKEFIEKKIKKTSPW